MNKRSFMCLFCLLTTVSTEENKLDIKVKEGDTGLILNCDGGTFPAHENKAEINFTWDASGDYQCDDSQGKSVIMTVKIRSSEDLIQLDTTATIAILVGDIAATVLIGWAVYSICAQPKPKSTYQGNKASDRQNLINNAAGDTYQPLGNRSDDYSSLQPNRKNKNKNQPLSP
ncbi:T-cell surface glycoprotein CD3 delta chain-like [Misgurnus anguillicaudatus]|uniref:T-cell surface glycoprotein CD3 delta chain n=1 Tax=Misgurnus anguillicaudatus TaxID=75329 RepID=UPI003CCF0A03